MKCRDASISSAEAIEAGLNSMPVGEEQQSNLSRSSLRDMLWAKQEPSDSMLLR
jgi:hypothetical protein